MQKFSHALWLVLLIPTLAFAESAEFGAERLIPLHQAKIDAGGTESEYISSRFETERNRIRALADQEVEELIARESEQALASQESALDKQLRLITALEESLKDREADLGLLVAEEKRFYTGPNLAGTGSAALKQTVSHADLLAKKTVEEIRMSVLKEHLSLQYARKQKLSRDLLLQQFGSMLELLKYALIILFTVGLDRLIRKRVIRRISSTKSRYFFLKVGSAIIYGIGVLWLLSSLLANHPSIFASLAIVGAGIAIALQDLIKDFVGWILILQRRYFKLGQRISIGNITGDVIDISPFRTTLLEVGGDNGPMSSKRTGKTLTVPNSKVLQEPVLNYNTTSDFVTSDLNITITYESNWQKAEEILNALLKKHTEEFSKQAQEQQRRRTTLFYTVWEVSDPQVHIDIAESGVQFSMRFYVPIGGRRTIVTALSRDILLAFDAEKSVELAYTTYRIVKNLSAD